MRIAVFGDSFANHELDNNSIGKAWVDVVAEQHELVNFGTSGSCFQYSYELFLQNYKDFDNVIFFVTDYNRSYIKNISSRLPFQGSSHMLHQSAGAEFTIKEITRLGFPDADHLISIVNNFRFYFDNYRDSEFELHVHDLLVKNIITLKPNALVVPCFPGSIPHFNPTDTVYTIQLAEAASLDVDLNNVWVDYYCLRKCHLCEENNIILGNKILHAMNNGFNYLDLHITDFVTKLDKPTEYYLKKHDK